ncbi:hypothetical protein HMPREF1552_01004, partial [Leptotrichia sp. oral taxon 879 str. F0557]
MFYLLHIIASSILIFYCPVIPFSYRQDIYYHNRSLLSTTFFEF